MPKGKLKIAKSDAKKFKVSADVNGLKVGVTKLLPGDILLTEVQYSNIQQIADTMAQMSSFTGKELDAEPAEKK